MARSSTVSSPAAALRTGEIFAAGVDVFWKEPPEPSHPLMALDNVLVTQLETPGDFNFDESLDLLDFGILADNFNEPGQFTDGDINIDGVVNMTDFIEWYSLYRAQEDPAGAAAVPEPAAGMLMLLGCIGLLGNSRKRRN